MGLSHPTLLLLLSHLAFLLVSSSAVLPPSQAPAPAPAHHHHHHHPHPHPLIKPHPHLAPAYAPSKPPVPPPVKPPTKAPAYPPVKPPTTKPPVQPPVKPPTAKPPVKPPTAKPPVQPPVQPPVKPPTTKPPVKPPTTKPPVKPPTTKPPVKPPTTKPPVKPPTTKPPVQPPVKPPPTKPPTYPPVKPLPKKPMAVQGVVYCKNCSYSGVDTLLGSTALSGATVVMRCRTLKTVVTKNATTDKNGYFFMEAPKGVAPYNATKYCHVYLSKAPASAKCPRPSNLNGGRLGAILTPQKTPAPSVPYTVFNVGPFAFEPPVRRCHKPKPSDLPTQLAH